MTIFEYSCRAAIPFLPVVYQCVRREIRDFLRSAGGPIDLLDVGGRTSPYTVGLNARVTVSDLPRETELQHALHLGVTPEMTSALMRRRSNIQSVIYDDMTQTRLAEACFDCVVAVEVLEHVEQDDRFLANVSRILRKGGVFIMSTPNGDFIPKRNPDHKRHYHREHLAELLARHFSDVNVHYAVRSGYFHLKGLPGIVLDKPFRTVGAMAANVLNGIQSRGQAIGNQDQMTCHLIARAAR